MEQRQGVRATLCTYATYFIVRLIYQRDFCNVNLRHSCNNSRCETYEESYTRTYTTYIVRM